MKKTIALVAMCATAFTPILSTATYADTIPDPVAQHDGEELAGMEAQCNALAAAAKAAAGAPAADVWTGEIVVSTGNATRVAGPTEIDGTREIDLSTVNYAGDYVPSTLEIRGDPFRIGGSVNMFGDQWSTAGYWTDSTYEFNADFRSTFSYAFSCAISMEVYHPAEDIFVPADGAYVLNGEFGSSNDAIRGNCVAFTNLGFPISTRPDWWGNPDDPIFPYRGGSANGPREPAELNYHCKFEGTPSYIDHREEYFDDPVLVTEVAGTPIEVPQTDEDVRAFEDHGGRVDVTGEYHVGQVVICISPTTSTQTKKGVPGTWVAKNGYELAPHSGAKCTTDWFANFAVWGSGTEGSNGTYISVPEYTFF